jgi:hypothetical protein
VVFVIKIKNTEVYGWEAAIRGMRSPMNSWDKSDSTFIDVFDDYENINTYYSKSADIGANDLSLMKKLVSAGSDHSKFMRMITVTCDITAPMYWWKEFDTYKVGTVRNSCSTMHTIHQKEFTLDDFSHEHILFWDYEGEGDTTFKETFDHEEYICTSQSVLDHIITALNHYRKQYIETKDKEYWWQIIQLLSQSYNQRATVQLNYQVLRNMYHARKNHKLDEWVDFCRWVEESLPYSELITEG